jgi:hypothetical protein
MIYQIILITIISFFAQNYFFWWTICPITFFISFFFCKSKLEAFFNGFFGVGILNSFYFLFISIQNNFLLFDKLAQDFPKLISSPLFLFFLIFVLYGSVAFLSCLSGFFFKQIFSKK